jgi:hypothetical protein
MPYSQEVANVLTPWRRVLRVERIVCCELEDACDGLAVTPGHKLPGQNLDTFSTPYGGCSALDEVQRLRAKCIAWRYVGTKPE